MSNDFVFCVVGSHIASSPPTSYSINPPRDFPNSSTFPPPRSFTAGLKHQYPSLKARGCEWDMKVVFG